MNVLWFVILGSCLAFLYGCSDDSRDVSEDTVRAVPVDCFVDEDRGGHVDHALLRVAAFKQVLSHLKSSPESSPEPAGGYYICCSDDELMALRKYLEPRRSRFIYNSGAYLKFDEAGRIVSKETGKRPVIVSIIESWGDNSVAYVGVDFSYTPLAAGGKVYVFKKDLNGAWVFEEEVDPDAVGKRYLVS